MLLSTVVPGGVAMSHAASAGWNLRPDRVWPLRRTDLLVPYRRVERLAWRALWFHPAFWAHLLGNLPPCTDHIRHGASSPPSLIGLVKPVPAHSSGRDAVQRASGPLHRAFPVDVNGPQTALDTTASAVMTSLARTTVASTPSMRARCCETGPRGSTTAHPSRHGTPSASLQHRTARGGRRKIPFCRRPGSVPGPSPLARLPRRTQAAGEPGAAGARRPVLQRLDARDGINVLGEFLQDGLRHGRACFLD